jgi:excisionase family DNA binding protein
MMAARTVTTAEAARLLGVTQQRVQTLCRQRRIRGARLIANRTWLLPANFKVTPGTRGPRPR